jgi:hypothetical protein
MRNLPPRTAEHPRGKPRFEAMPPIELLIRKLPGNAIAARRGKS